MTKNVSLSFAHSYDTGAWPSIAINATGIAVEVHQSQTFETLYYHVGTTEGGVWNSGGSSEYDSGVTPSVAMNDSGTVVEVHQSNGLSSKMWYHVGSVNAGATAVDWGDSHDYDSGDTPKVAINNGNVAVEVHQSDGPSTALWYHVGIVNPGNKTIDWGGSHEYDSGVVPAIGLNNNGVVVEVHQTNGVDFSLWYHVGIVNSGNKTIDWGDSHQYDSGIAPAVIVTDDNFIVEVHQSQGFNTLWYRTGTVDPNAKTVTWNGDAVQYGNGSLPRIGTNNAQIMEVQTNGTALSYAISDISERGDWMQNHLPLLGSRVLKQLVMPASHDAGMYTVQKCSGLINFGANACNTQTQVLSIAQQLEAGSRYFDIRPVLDDDGVMYTGHFDTGTGLGCDGPTLATVLSDAASFAAAHRELVILKFSHYYVRATKQTFNADQMRALSQQVYNALGSALYVTTNPLGTIALSTFIAQKGVILPVFADFTDSLKNSFPGLYSYSDYPPAAGVHADLTVYDNYSDTNNLNRMVDGQIGQLVDQANHGGDMFLLSWTLTQSQEQAIACGAQVGVTSILDLADTADTALWPQMVATMGTGRINQQTVPNLVYIDSMLGFATDVAVWFNQNLPTGNTMGGNAFMVPGGRYYSPDQQYFLAYQSDGNLVLYSADGTAVWASNTYGKPAWRTCMQSDGNFVVYSGPGAPVWASGTNGNANATMKVLDTGHFAIVDAGGGVIRQFP